ncbi:MFS transporter, DHA1 family, bicyclomycin/chloramphenicol resistance protein [Arboricoccus pini]|uniref:MFS transporter, DHA1 family, bicyclomycin/chloramphenicol resistance protein n=1 Tax=Arboricoccus pini TaxID=1963835 RepID=A0A212QQD9_9PROT|nr:MFS transporter, DHA1 family, bicyclomycin/chloramphenicol resistance protein [Arboricoccus pini]
MIERLGSWRLIFVFLVAYGMMLLVLVWRFLPESIRDYQLDALGPRRLLAGYVVLFAHRSTLSATLIVAFAYAILNVYLTNAPAIFMVAHGMDEQSFAIGFAVVAAFVAIGNLVNARLCRLVALRSVIRIGLCGTLAAALLLLLIDRLAPGSGWALVSGFCLLFVFYGLILANATALAMQGHAGMVGAISSSLGVVQTAIAALFGALAAFLFDGTARPALFTILGCALLCLAIIRWIARPAA